MKKNQQSIDGFTPRRRKAEAVEKTNQKPQKTEAKISSRREKVSKNIEKLSHEQPQIHSSDEEINSALANLEIDNSEEVRADRREQELKRSKKEEKLQKRLEKFNSKREKKGKKQLSIKQFKRRKIIRRILFLILIGAIVYGGSIVYPFLKNFSKISKDGNVFGIFQKEKLKEDSNGRTNFLIFGTSPDGWDGQDLADSIMVVSLNQDSKKAYTVSLPRDLWVKHTCSGWLGTYAGKLNETYGCGKYSNGLNITDESAAETNGQQAMAETAKEVTGLDIHYTIHANWQVLVQAIDAVGGIDVKVEVWDGSPEMYDYATKVRYKNGEVAHMNGEQALAFSRARGSAGGYGLSGGNFDRERNQQKIVQATLEKINASKFDVSKLIGIADALGDNVKTTFKSSEYQTLADVALSLKSSNIKSIPLVNSENSAENFLTTGMVATSSAVIPVAGTYDYSDIQAFISKKTISNEISEENAKVIVLNGTQISGLAAEQQKKLKSEGFNITEIDSAPTQDYAKTQIFVINSEKTATIQKLKSKFSAKSSSKLPDSLSKYKESADIIVILGEDE